MSIGESTTVNKSGTDLQSLVRQQVRDLPSYVPATGAAKKSDRLIRLDMNESPYGPSPRTRAALADFVQTNRYPDFAQSALRTALADYTGVAVERIVCGAGLDDVFTSLAHLMIDPGDDVIISEPTFGVYRPLFSLHGAHVVNVPLTDTFGLQPKAIVEATGERAKIIVICSPNNPTGNLFPMDEIEYICANTTCLVAIDEAYVEFSGQSHIPLMDRYPNVMILRTMSKWAGLAGMRVGYGLVPEQLVDSFRHVVPPFHNVALASSEAAIASIEDRHYLLKQVGSICVARDHLYDQLAKVAGLTPLPSVTNFILVKTHFLDARPLVQAIADRGVLIRAYSDPLLQPYFRVSVGLPEENDLFLSALHESIELQPK
jgi:histidinol-phosphate aminotransferase